MKKVKAYTLPCILKKQFQSEMPADLEILSVEVYNGSPTLFCVTDDETDKKVKRNFRFYGNEEEILEHQGIFLGTIIVSGKVCLHLFEIPQPASGLLLPPA